MKDIRALDNDTIKKYHASYYRPNNLCVIVTGKVLDCARVAICFHLNGSGECAGVRAWLRNEKMSYSK